MVVLLPKYQSEKNCTSKSSSYSHISTSSSSLSKQKMSDIDNPVKTALGTYNSYYLDECNISHNDLSPSSRVPFKTKQYTTGLNDDFSGGGENDIQGGYNGASNYIGIKGNSQGQVQANKSLSKESGIRGNDFSSKIKRQPTPFRDASCNYSELTSINERLMMRSSNQKHVLRKDSLCQNTYPDGCQFGQNDQRGPYQLKIEADPQVVCLSGNPEENQKQFVRNLPVERLDGRLIPKIPAMIQPYSKYNYQTENRFFSTGKRSHCSPEQQIKNYYSTSLSPFNNGSQQRENASVSPVPQLIHKATVPVVYISPRSRSPARSRDPVGGFMSTSSLSISPPAPASSQVTYFKKIPGSIEQWKCDGEQVSSHRCHLTPKSALPLTSVSSLDAFKNIFQGLGKESHNEWNEYSCQTSDPVPCSNHKKSERRISPMENIEESTIMVDRKTEVLEHPSSYFPQEQSFQSSSFSRNSPREQVCYPFSSINLTQRQNIDGYSNDISNFVSPPKGRKNGKLTLMFDRRAYESPYPLIDTPSIIANNSKLLQVPVSIVKRDQRSVYNLDDEQEIRRRGGGHSLNCHSLYYGNSPPPFENATFPSQGYVQQSSFEKTFENNQLSSSAKTPQEVEYRPFLSSMNLEPRKEISREKSDRQKNQTSNLLSSATQTTFDVRKKTFDCGIQTELTEKADPYKHVLEHTPVVTRNDLHEVIAGFLFELYQTDGLTQKGKIFERLLQFMGNGEIRSTIGSKQVTDIIYGFEALRQLVPPDLCTTTDRNEHFESPTPYRSVSFNSTKRQDFFSRETGERMESTEVNPGSQQSRQPVTTDHGNSVPHPLYLSTKEISVSQTPEVMRNNMEVLSYSPEPVLRDVADENEEQRDGKEEKNVNDQQDQSSTERQAEDFSSKSEVFSHFKGSEVNNNDWDTQGQLRSNLYTEKKGSPLPNPTISFNESPERSRPKSRGFSDEEGAEEQETKKEEGSVERDTHNCNSPFARSADARPRETLTPAKSIFGRRPIEEEKENSTDNSEEDNSNREHLEYESHSQEEVSEGEDVEAYDEEKEENEEKTEQLESTSVNDQGDTNEVQGYLMSNNFSPSREEGLPMRNVEERPVMMSPTTMRNYEIVHSDGRDESQESSKEKDEDQIKHNTEDAAKSKELVKPAVPLATKEDEHQEHRSPSRSPAPRAPNEVTGSRNVSVKHQFSFPSSKGNSHSTESHIDLHRKTCSKEKALKKSYSEEHGILPTNTTTTTTTITTTKKRGERELPSYMKPTLSVTSKYSKKSQDSRSQTFHSETFLLRSDDFSLSETQLNNHLTPKMEESNKYALNKNTKQISNNKNGLSTGSSYRKRERSCDPLPIPCLEVSHTLSNENLSMLSLDTLDTDLLPPSVTFSAGDTSSQFLSGINKELTNQSPTSCLAQRSSPQRRHPRSPAKMALCPIPTTASLPLSSSKSAEHSSSPVQKRIRSETDNHKCLYDVAINRNSNSYGGRDQEGTEEKFNKSTGIKTPLSTLTPRRYLKICEKRLFATDFNESHSPSFVGVEMGASECKNETISEAMIDYSFTEEQDLLTSGNKQQRLDHAIRNHPIRRLLAVNNGVTAKKILNSLHSHDACRTLNDSAAKAAPKGERLSVSPCRSFSSAEAKCDVRSGFLPFNLVLRTMRRHLLNTAADVLGADEQGKTENSISLSPTEIAFLDKLSSLCSELHALLVVDEALTKTKNNKQQEDNKEKEEPSMLSHLFPLELFNVTLPNTGNPISAIASVEESTLPIPYEELLQRLS